MGEIETGVLSYSKMAGPDYSFLNLRVTTF